MFKRSGFVSKKNDFLFGNYPERGTDFRTYMLFLLAGIFISFIGLANDLLTNNVSLFSIIVKLSISAVLVFNFLWSRFASTWKWTNIVTALMIPFFILPGGWLTNGGMAAGFQYYPVIMAMIITAISGGWFRISLLVVYSAVFMMLVCNPVFCNGFEEWSHIDYLTPDVIMERKIVHLFINIVMTAILFSLYVERTRKQGVLIQESSEKLEVLSPTDKLSQTSSHRHIMEELNNEVARSARYESDLAVLLIDVNFPNDSNIMEECRDIVLKDVGRTLINHLRSTDRAGRYGAEEFVVILPEQSITKAVIVAKKLQAAIGVLENKKCEWNGINISIGTAQWKKDEPPAFLVSRANSAMLKARESGMNGVVISQE